MERLLLHTGGAEQLARHYCSRRAQPIVFRGVVVLIKHPVWVGCDVRAQAEVNLVTALVPSDTACLASSPGRIRRTAVWISRLVTVGFLE